MSHHLMSSCPTLVVVLILGASLVHSEERTYDVSALIAHAELPTAGDLPAWLATDAAAPTPESDGFPPWHPRPTTLDAWATQWFDPAEAKLVISTGVLTGTTLRLSAEEAMHQTVAEGLVRKQRGLQRLLSFSANLILLPQNKKTGEVFFRTERETEPASWQWLTLGSRQGPVSYAIIPSDVADRVDDQLGVEAVRRHGCTSVSFPVVAAYHDQEVVLAARDFPLRHGNHPADWRWTVDAAVRLRTTATADPDVLVTQVEVDLASGGDDPDPPVALRHRWMRCVHRVDQNLVLFVPDIPGLDGPQNGLLIIRPLVVGTDVIATTHVPSSADQPIVAKVIIGDTVDHDRLQEQLNLRPGVRFSNELLSADTKLVGSKNRARRMCSSQSRTRTGFLVITIAVSERRPLQIGDLAPPLSMAAWPHGAALERLDDGRLTVVEFAHTWQHLTQDAWPRLAAIEARFAEREIRTIAVKIPPPAQLERIPSLPALVLGRRLHHLGVDQSVAEGGGVTANAWLREAGCWLARDERYRTPMAFIVGGDGRIRWIGDPRRGLERIVDEIYAGTWVGLSVMRADSEQINAGEMANYAADGDPLTIWHTQWSGGHPPCPHEIVLALSQECDLNGVTYLPRQNPSTNGTIGDYELYLSRDGVEFGAPVQSGTFASDKTLKVMSFPPQRARFIKLRALSEINGRPWSSAAEIGILRPGDPPPVMPVILPLEAEEVATPGADDF